VIGRLIAGRYELATIIGQGGMGQVWTAYDRRLDRRVAVKLLRPDRVAGGEDVTELRGRFDRECRVTAQVDHPGLVTVHDAGADEDELYLVMQYVEGADLGDHLAEHDPYPWRWAVAVAAQLCAVLSAVHAVPIVHRDLKPRNVMIKPDGTVTVLDLGVASVLDTDTTRLTHTGSPIGSPAYMAPEQAMGGAVGPRTDLYALGVLLHELLSGQVPFAGTTALGVLHRHLYEAPVPLRRLRPEVPEPLEALVLRLLAKDPQHRPAGGQDVYRELAALLPAPGGHHAPAGPMDPTRPFLRPHAPWPERPAPPAERPAPAPAVAPAAGPDLAAAVDEVKRLLDAGRITQAVDKLGGIIPAAAEKHGEHSPVLRTLRKQYAATLMEDGQYRRALPELRRLSDEFASQYGGADRQALRFRYEAAQCMEQLGDTRTAIGEYRVLLPYFERYGATDPGPPLDIRRRIGHLLLSVGDRRAAREVLTRLLYDAERVHGPHHPFPGEVRRTLAWLGQVQG
jgi:hypothetical protein